MLLTGESGTYRTTIECAPVEPQTPALGLVRIDGAGDDAGQGREI